MYSLFIHHEPCKSGESGFVLVFSLVVLLMLSLFGAWALQTSNFELNIAGSLQQAERQFNIAEGAASTEAANLGFNRRTFYQISDPTKLNKPLHPPHTNALQFDPGNDNPVEKTPEFEDVTTWPWRNLWAVDDNDDTWITMTAKEKSLPEHNDLDYRYLVTYLHPDVPPMGYDPSSFSGYKFRIQGNTARTTMLVELGGTKIGVKAQL
jgi:hypothetical protein